jgi:hypothetical protein
METIFSVEPFLAHSRLLVSIPGTGQQAAETIRIMYPRAHIVLRGFLVNNIHIKCIF